MDGTHWDFPLGRNLEDWEVNTYLDLLDGLYQALPHFGKEDRRCWEWETNKTYSVKSYYGVLVEERAERIPQPNERIPNFPFKMIWG